MTYFPVQRSTAVTKINAGTQEHLIATCSLLFPVKPDTAGDKAFATLELWFLQRVDFPIEKSVLFARLLVPSDKIDNSLS